MRRLSWIMLAGLVVGGCEAEAASSPTPDEPSTAAQDRPEPEATPSERTTAPEAPLPAEAAALRSIDLDPARGALREQLLLHSNKIRKAGRIPVVQMRARWCPICKRVDAQLAKPKAQTTLAEVTLIRVDTDIWAEDLKPTGLTSPTIPAFYTLDRQGRPAALLSGHRWGPRVDALARLHTFIQKNQ